MTVFEGKKSSNDIIINDTMSDDEVVASDVPPRCLLDATTHLFKRACPSIRLSVRLSVRPYVPCYFRMTNMAVFEGNKYRGGT